MARVVAEVAWPILERIRLFGDFAVSPHGISIALGFLAGAQLMLATARRRGVARRQLDRGGPDVADVISALVTRAALGAIVGARFFFVVTRLEEFGDPLSWLRVWEGGLSLLGGITGAVLAGIPYVRRHRLSLPLVLDSVAPGLALGIFVGRIGDLVIGEHLGGRTDFVLGWRCTGQLDDPGAPYPWPGTAVPQGCFDEVVHQTALYDFIAGGLVWAALMLLARRPRFDGFFTAAFVVLYGGGRFVTDFARAADIDLVRLGGLGLTGSQVSAVLAISAVLVFLAVARPWRHRPWAWSPPDFAHGWGRRPPRADVPEPAGGGGEPGADADVGEPAGPEGRAGAIPSERER